MICASIVLYNPNIGMLKRNIDAVEPQVDDVVLIDNGSSNSDEIKELLDNYSGTSISIIWLGENKGIAEALNEALRYANNKKAGWLLTLDQDSVVPSDMIDKFNKYLSLKKVGQLSINFYNPSNNDANSNKVDRFNKGETNKPYYEIDACITSGCLMNVDVAFEVGLFDSRLFIDCVDLDYSFRLRQHGYKVYRINEISMEHHLGNARKRKFLFFTYTDYQYSKIRVYYQARNNVYMIRKYKEDKWDFIVTLMHTFFCNVLDGRWESIKMFFKGISDGFKLETIINE